MKRLEDYLDSCTAALIVTPVNRRYLTGFESSLGYLFVTQNESKLIVDGRYYLAAKQRIKESEVVLLDKLSVQLKVFAKNSGIKRVVTENNITVAEFNRYKEIFQGLEVLADDSLSEFLDELRSVKTEQEVRCIIEAQRIAEKAFLEVLNILKPGVSEKHIATELEYKMKRFGAEKESFDTIVVSGTKSAMPHGVPDGKLLKNGDFVTFDFGATVNGYHSDMTRTVAIGFATDKMQLVYETVLSAQDAAERTVKAGVKCLDVDKAARDVIANAGFGEFFTHSTGHSVGLKIHELPNLSPKSESILKVGNVVTNEPGIYIENEFGVRIEDMLLVTELGCLNLTEFEKTLIIVR